MAFDSGGLLAWFVVGLIAGGFASIGALVGGVLFGALLPGNSASWIGSAVVTATGAVSLLVAIRAAAPRRWFGL